jgi:phage tail-like protein
MSTMNPGDSLTAHNFAIQIDGIRCAWFSKISGLGKSVKVISHTQNNPQGRPKVSKSPGTSEGGEVTLSRGSDQTADFKQWVQEGVDGNMAVARKNISVIYMDYMGNPIKRFNLINAWACDHTYGELEAGSGSPLNEDVKITYEDIEEVEG